MSAVAAASAPTVSPESFAAWLRGFMDACGDKVTPEQLAKAGTTWQMTPLAGTTCVAPPRG